MDLEQGTNGWQCGGHSSGDVRGLAVHPTLPLVLTGGSDKLLRLWNSERRVATLTR